MHSLRYLLPLLFCIACDTPQDGVRTPITRTASDVQLTQQETIAAPVTYPWDRWDRDILPIQAAHFRCKGSTTHPIKKVEGTYYADCRGSGGHSLPLIGGEPGVYPILITLLNHVQEDLGRPVEVTCGHRCPTHNTYADPSKWGQTSKHMIGAEVDFYVVGLEAEPEKVVESLMGFYQKGAAYEGKRIYTEFVRYEKETDVATLPWYNREVFIKLYGEGEGRDGDNQHPYPYIGIQVRYDSEKGEAVTYTWQKANNNFLRE